MRSEIRLEFRVVKDKYEKPYLLCRPNLPAMVDLRDAVFFFWPNDEDGPTMTIALRDDNRGESGERRSPRGRRGLPPGEEP